MLKARFPASKGGTPVLSVTPSLGAAQEHMSEKFPRLSSEVFSFSFLPSRPLSLVFQPTILSLPWTRHPQNLIRRPFVVTQQTCSPDPTNASPIKLASSTLILARPEMRTPQLLAGNLPSPWMRTTLAAPADPVMLSRLTRTSQPLTSRGFSTISKETTIFPTTQEVRSDTSSNRPSTT